LENQPRQQTNKHSLPKESETPPKGGIHGVKLLWHWLTSTLLSSQRTNTHRISNQPATSVGATSLTYTLRFSQSNQIVLLSETKISMCALDNDRLRRRLLVNFTGRPPWLAVKRSDRIVRCPAGVSYLTRSVRCHQIDQLDRMAATRPFRDRQLSHRSRPTDSPGTSLCSGDVTEVSFGARKSYADQGMSVKSPRHVPRHKKILGQQDSQAAHPSGQHDACRGRRRARSAAPLQFVDHVGHVGLCR
jgi:hypothetical protein